MDRKAFSFFFLGILVGAMLIAMVLIPSIKELRSSKQHSNGEVVLKLAHVLDQTHPVHLAMEHMAKRLTDLSGGQVTLQIFPSGQLGSEAECIEQLQRGSLDMVKTSTAALEGFVPEMAVFSLPYLFADEAHFWKVVDGEIGKELLMVGQGNGVRGLCYYDSGSRSFYTVDKAVLSANDLLHLKIRTQESRMAMDMISAMGGAPTPIPFGELYTALQQGMVDGAENNPPSFFTSRHYEIAKHYTLDEHTRVPDMVIFSTRIWDALSPSVRAWIEQAAQESVVYQRRLWTEKTQDALQAVQDAGVSVHRPNKESFAQAGANVLAALNDDLVKSLAKRIRDAK